jgi:hypothetical protein
LRKNRSLAYIFTFFALLMAALGNAAEEGEACVVNGWMAVVSLDSPGQGGSNGTGFGVGVAVLGEI